MARSRDWSLSSASSAGMEEQTNIAIRVLVDILSLILAGLTSAVLNWSKTEPYQRGFYCDDESLRYPYRSDTVTTTTLFAVAAWIPAIAIGVLEAVEIFGMRQRRPPVRRLRFFCIPIHPFVYSFGWFYVAFGFGAFVNQGITDIGKYSIGRMRPHFVSACKPDVDISNCITGQYLTNFTCTEADGYKRRNARLSFPSGHSSLAAYAMLYTACYLQVRFPKWDHTLLLKHLLQFICLALAWACGMSRVSDYKHHWSDVLAGFLIGTIVAFLVVVFVTDRFKEPSPSRENSRDAQEGPQQVLVMKPPGSDLGSSS